MYDSLLSSALKMAMYLLFPDHTVQMKGIVNVLITLSLSKVCHSLLEKSSFIEKNQTKTKCRKKETQKTPPKPQGV